MWANQSRDAKFCVSQARMRNKQMRNMPVITAFFARETQGGAINDARRGYKQMLLYACHCRAFCSGDARFCVSTGLTPLLSWDKKTCK